jgi:uncharacterized membrane protein
VNAIGRNIVRGLSVVVPLVLTIWLIVWFAKQTEWILGNVFVFLFTEDLYIPGLGALLGLILISLVGFMVQLFIFERIWHWLESLVERIPVVKSIYGGLRDLTSLFSTDPTQQETKVALIEIAEGIRAVGLVTGSVPAAISPGDESRIAVYIPMSYQVGGFTVLVPPDRVELLDVPLEEAMRFVLTAGIGKSDRPKGPNSGR